MRDHGIDLLHDYGHILEYIHVIGLLEQLVNLFLTVKMYQKQQWQFS